MAERTSIEWTASADGTSGASWNPIRARVWEIQSDGSGKERIGWHCAHVSEGCRNCYAEGINRRLGTGREYKPDELFQPERVGFRNGEVKAFLDETAFVKPLHWKKARKIFPCSMTDIFADFVTDEMLDRVFTVIALVPQHTIIMLTKRSARMRKYITDLRLSGRWILWKHPEYGHDIFDQIVATYEMMFRHLWLLVSAENQKAADQRIPDLLETPAAVRGVSVEPMLGPIDLERYLMSCEGCGNRGSVAFEVTYDTYATSLCRRACSKHGEGPSLDWVICGGESGPGRRPIDLAWARSIRDQCADAGVAFFGKQDDGKRPLPDDLMVRQFPEVRHG